MILGAAVLDDVLSLLVLGGLTAWASAAQTGAPFQGTQIAALVLKAIGFFGLVLVAGTWWTPAWFRGAAHLRTRDALLATGLCLCFVLSWAASAIGLAALVGAFAAGLILEDSHSAMFVARGEPSLGEMLQPMVSFLVPLFFVLVGFRTDLRVFAQPGVGLLLTGLTVAAILGKGLCAAGVLKRGVNRWTVAAGMFPRGEVTLVFAALGGTLRVGDRPVLDATGYAALVGVVILTTLVAPPALKVTIVKPPHAPAES